MSSNTGYLLLFVLLLFSGALAEKEDDEAIVETVEENTSNDIPYESPKVPDPAAVYFAEHFDNPVKFEKRWIKSKAKKEGIEEDIAKYDGVWSVEPSQKDGLPGDMGLVLKSKAKHAAISSSLFKPFVFDKKPLIVQYEVLLQDGQECGGAYLKLLSDTQENKNLNNFHDKSPYTIMFGPDKCGNDHKLHFIFKHRNPLNGSVEEKHCQKPKERLEEIFSDKLPHLYTLVIKPDNSFEVSVDKKVINSGSLLEDFVPPVNPPREIDDPNDKKPEDWDEREKIPDPDAKKPDDWDEDAPAQIIDETAVMPEGWLENEPTHIADPDAVKPADWDSDMDGEWEPPLIENPVCDTAPGCGHWEPPLINNPAFKGKWRPPLIDNPNYKGKWRPRKIPNPDFFEDTTPFKMHTVSAVGFELWSMSKDILFDNIIITDDVIVAERWASSTFDKKRQKIAKDSDSCQTAPKVTENGPHKIHGDLMELSKAVVSVCLGAVVQTAIRLFYEIMNYSQLRVEVLKYSSWWGKTMKALNYKPKTWAAYAVYCSIPLVFYIYYLYRCVKEESVIQKLAEVTNDYPILWGVYIVVLAIPVVFVLYLCCRPSSSASQPQEKEEQLLSEAAEKKKTDEVSEDIEEENNEIETETEAKADVNDEDPEKNSDPDSEEDNEAVVEEPTESKAGGDGARKRKVRKD